jgi:RES domain-containing protein
MLPAPALAAALTKADLIVVHGPWWRVVALRHLAKNRPEPLYSAGSKIAGARFTPQGSFDSLYLTEDAVTGLAEVNSLVILPAGPTAFPTEPFAVITLDGVLTRVLDLTDSAIQTALGTNEQELTGAWITIPTPPTQVLAQAAYDSGLIAGIRYSSARYPGKKNLVVFPDRLTVHNVDYLEVVDPHGTLRGRIGR